MTLKQLKKRLNPVVQRFGYYTAYEISHDEFVYGDRDTQVRVMENYLRKNGYETPPQFAGVELTAAKIHPEPPHEVHAESLRKVNSDNPRWQWHVHLFDSYVGGVEVFSHYEMRPDFKKIAGEDTSEMIGRLKIHYRPEYQVDYYRGRTDHVVEDLVSD